MKENGKILIHACPEREWYVRKYLMPELQRQMDEMTTEMDVLAYCDRKRLGNQKAFIDSIKTINEYAGDAHANTWHLQDDVWPSGDFIRTIDLFARVPGIICGFGTRTACRGKSPGWTTACGMYTSFQCIRIDDQMLRDFRDYVIHRYSKDIKTDKWDDALFAEYLNRKAPYFPVLNLAPSIVEHVDYIIGGSVINKQRKYRPTAIEFDQKAVEDLMNRLREGEKQ